MVERLGLAGLGREELGRPARVPHRLPGLGELHLLRAFVGDHECDPAAVKFVPHGMGSSRVAVLGTGRLRGGSGLRYHTAATANPCPGKRGHVLAVSQGRCRVGGRAAENPWTGRR